LPCKLKSDDACTLGRGGFALAFESSQSGPPFADEYEAAESAVVPDSR